MLIQHVHVCVYVIAIWSAYAFLCFHMNVKKRKSNLRFIKSRNMKTLWDFTILDKYEQLAL